MSDVREGTPVDERRISFKRLGDVGQEGLAQQQRHRPSPTDVTCFDRVAFGGGSNNDVSQSLAQVGVILGQHENGHHFAGGRDVETIFANVAVRRAAHSNHDVPQRTIVHVDDPWPRNSSRVEFGLVAVLDVVVDEGRQQVVSGGYGMQVPGQVQIDVFHGQHLRMATARCTTFDAEHRTH